MDPLFPSQTPDNTIKKKFPNPCAAKTIDFCFHQWNYLDQDISCCSRFLQDCHSPGRSLIPTLGPESLIHTQLCNHCKSTTLLPNAGFSGILRCLQSIGPNMFMLNIKGMTWLCKHRLLTVLRGCPASNYGQAAIGGDSACREHSWAAGAGCWAALSCSCEFWMWSRLTQAIPSLF